MSQKKIKEIFDYMKICVDEHDLKVKKCDKHQHNAFIDEMMNYINQYEDEVNKMFTLSETESEELSDYDSD